MSAKIMIPRGLLKGKPINFKILTELCILSW